MSASGQTKLKILLEKASARSNYVRVYSDEVCIDGNWDKDSLRDLVKLLTHLIKIYERTQTD